MSEQNLQISIIEIRDLSSVVININDVSSVIINIQNRVKKYNSVEKNKRNVGRAGWLIRSKFNTRDLFSMFFCFSKF